MRLTILKLSVFLLSLCAVSRAQQWTEVRSPHFTLITDSGEKRGREVALRFEQLHDSFGVILQKVKVNTPIPVTIIAVRSNKELSPYAPLFHGKPIQLAGFFQQGPDRDFIIVDLSSEAGWQVVYHEYAHLLLHANFNELPAWFDEGFAEYFSTFHIDKKDLYFGEMSDSEQYTLLQNSWMKSAHLFSIDHSSPEYNESSDHRSVFYAQSWLTVHYLQDKHKMAEASKFVEEVQFHHAAIPTAFQAAFGMSTEQFDKELQNYFHGANQMHYYRHPAPPGLGEGAYSARPITPLDAQASLADLHLHEMDYRAKAVDEFRAILQKDPNNAIANRGLGYSLVIQGKGDDALPLLEKAVEAGPNDAQGHYLYAFVLSQRLGFGDDVSMETRIATTMKEAQAAVALNPEFAEAYEILGRAAMLKHDDATAKPALLRAIELSPQNETYRFNLAAFYMNNRNWETAKQVLLRVANAPGATMAEQARNQIANIESMQHQEKFGPPEFTRQPSTADTNEEPKLVNLSGAPPVHFVKGKLLKVDCSTAPGARFIVDVSGQQWTFSASDRKHVVVLGEDDLSCDWHDRKVAINYRDNGDKAGDIISLELQ